MAGDADAAARVAPRSRTLRIALIVALVVILAASATLYYVFFARNPSPNTPPHGLGILVSPSAGNNTTTFRFTAQVTDDQDPTIAIQVRWDWQDDGTWDTGWSTNKSASHVFPVAGGYVIKMEAEDTRGLTANVTAGLTVSATDLPPSIRAIEISPRSGTNATMFTFTANVTDDHDPVSEIQVRWDWQSDGVWDVNWSTTKVAQHRFPVAGNYTVTLEARDTTGLASYATILLTVSRVGKQPPPLRIGTVLSLTGALSIYGVAEQNGVTMAVEEINANGGALGQPIQLFNMDDTTTPGIAYQDALHLATFDNVTVIIGSTGSGMCVQVLPVAMSYGVFEVAPSCTSPIFSNLSYTGGWFARTVPSDALQALVAAHYAYDNLSIRYSAVIGINNAYGTLTAAAYANNFTRLGGTITDNPPMIVPEFPSVTDYTPYLQQVMSAATPPALVYLVAYPPDGVQMMKNWNTLLAAHPTWTSVRWLFSEGLYDPSFLNPLVSAGVNVSAFQGTSPAPYGGIEPAGYGPWAARYQTLFGVPPELFAANAYDATYLVALAAQAAGNTSGASIRTQLRAVANPPGTLVGPNQWGLAAQELAAGRDINFDGASGTVNVGAHGDVPGSYIIWGVNATNQLVTREVFNESLVISFSQPGTYLRQAVLAYPASVTARTRDPWP